MAVAEQESPAETGKAWTLFKLPFRHSASSSSSSSQQQQPQQLGFSNSHAEGSNRQQQRSRNSVGFVARSLLPTRRRLRLDPSNRLYFPYEPGKQVRSAIKIKNTTKSHVAFKFQTTAPKSCFMRPPGAILAPGESIIATVFKFIEHPESGDKPVELRSKVKFKIMSLKVKDVMDYAPELNSTPQIPDWAIMNGIPRSYKFFKFDEQKEQVATEQILRVVFLDVEQPTPALEKLKRQLAEAEAALETRKKPSEDTGLKIIGEGLVIDEWKERRERHLARQQSEVVDSF